MQFRLAHRPLQTQEQSVVKMRGIVEPIVVEQQRPGQCADFQKPVPVARVARQARHLQAHHDAGSVWRAHLGHRPWKLLLFGRAAARLPLVAPITTT